MNASLLLWLPFDLVHDIGWTLIHFLWQGALLTALLELALPFCGQARTRYTVAFVALLAMAIAPIATFLVVHTSAIQIAPLAALPSAWPALEAAFIGSDDAPLARAILWMNWVVLAWLVGIAVLGLRVAAGWYATRRLVHRDTAALPAPLLARCEELLRLVGVTRPVRFLQSAAVHIPAVVGWLRPVVLLPIAVVTGFTRPQIEAVIVHELAHVRRLDVFANLLQIAVETVLFYHPGVWWVSRRIRLERESCCDDFAVSLSGDVLAYARTLVTLAEQRALPAPAVAAASGPLTQRVARLLGIRVKSGNAAAVVVAAVALATLAGCVAVRSASNAPAQASTASSPSPEERARMVANMERMRRESLEMAQEMHDRLQKQDDITRIRDESARKKATAELNRAGLETSSQRLTESHQRQIADLQREQDEITRIPDEVARKAALASPAFVVRQQLIEVVRQQQDMQRQRDEVQGIADETARRAASLALNPRTRELQIEWQRLSQERIRLMEEASAQKQRDNLDALARRQEDLKRQLSAAPDSPQQNALRQEQSRLQEELALKKAQAAHAEMMQRNSRETMQLAQESSQRMDRFGRQREEARLIQDEAVRQKRMEEIAAVERQERLEILRRQIALARQQQDIWTNRPMLGTPPKTPEEAESRKVSAARVAASGQQLVDLLVTQEKQLLAEDEAWRIPDEAARKKALSALAEARRQQMLEDSKRRLEQAKQRMQDPLPVPPATP